MLGNTTHVVARMSRAKSNAAVLTFTSGDGTEIARARQKGGAGVLFGFRNAGRGTYYLDGGGDTIEVKVASTTTVCRGQLTIARVSPDGSGARIEDGNSTALLTIGGYAGDKNDAAWRLPLTDPGGKAVGVLTLVRRNDGFGEFGRWIALEVLGQLNVNQPFPTQGAVIELDAPLHEHVGDSLLAACVDACMLGRGQVIAA